MKINLKSMMLGVGLMLVFVGALIFAGNKRFFVDGYTWETMVDSDGLGFQQIGYIQGYLDAADLFSGELQLAIYMASHKVQLGTKAQQDSLEKLGYGAYSLITIDSLQCLNLQRMLTEVFKKYWPVGTNGQIREAITDFYSDYRMKRLQLPLAMRVIRLVLEGHTKEEIEQAKIYEIQLQKWYEVPSK